MYSVSYKHIPTMWLRNPLLEIYPDEIIDKKKITLKLTKSLMAWSILVHLGDETPQLDHY